MPKASIFSVESKDVSNDSNHQYHFGYFETRGRRGSQEDALVWHALESAEVQGLSPQQIAASLSKAYKTLDESVKKDIGNFQGTTASTTVYDGQDNIVTATLADAVSFAAVYGSDGLVKRVVRLNTVIHKPTLEGEKQRIEKLGGFIMFGRVNGTLAVSRAIGDHYGYQGNNGSKLISSDPALDITTVTALTQGLDNEPFTVKIITACDGFTETAEDTKEDHEDYLRSKLEKLGSIKNQNEEELAHFLADEAYKDGSGDNISVSVQTLIRGEAFFSGVYDGHGGQEVAAYVANNVGEIFLQECTLEMHSEHDLIKDDPKEIKHEKLDEIRQDESAEGKKEALEGEANHEVKIVLDFDEEDYIDVSSLKVISVKSPEDSKELSKPVNLEKDNDDKSSILLTFPDLDYVNNFKKEEDSKKNDDVIEFPIYSSSTLLSTLDLNYVNNLKKEGENSKKDAFPKGENKEQIDNKNHKDKKSKVKITENPYNPAIKKLKTYINRKPKHYWSFGIFKERKANHENNVAIAEALLKALQNPGVVTIDTVSKSKFPTKPEGHKIRSSDLKSIFKKAKNGYYKQEEHRDEKPTLWKSITSCFKRP